MPVNPTIYIHDFARANFAAVPTSTSYPVGSIIHNVSASLRLHA